MRKSTSTKLNVQIQKYCFESPTFVAVTHIRILDVQKLQVTIHLLVLKLLECGLEMWLSL